MKSPLIVNGFVIVTVSPLVLFIVLILAGVPPDNAPVIVKVPVPKALS